MFKPLEEGASLGDLHIPSHKVLRAYWVRQVMLIPSRRDTRIEATVSDDGASRFLGSDSRFYERLDVKFAGRKFGFFFLW